MSLMKRKSPVGSRVTNVGVSALAREVGLSTTTISAKLKAGVTAEQIREQYAQKQPFVGTKAERKPPKRPSANEYELIIQNRQRIGALDEMKFRRAKALAERQEIDNMVKRGELLPLSYVRTWATRYLTDGRDLLLNGPSELRDALAAETDPLRVDAILRVWLERVMAKWELLRTLWGEGEEEQVA